MTGQGRHLHIGLNVLNAGAHTATWQYGDDPFGFVDIDHYRKIARIAERGALDAIFLADGPGLREDPRIRPAQALEPTVVLTALAAETERIGLIATASTTFNDPYNLARRLSSLDHVSRGRLGWNAVTTYDPVVAPNFGLPELPGHDDRYARAAEFIDVATKLWDSWQDDALVGDTGSGLFADADRVHAIEHEGQRFSVRGALNLSRSPQGRPVLVQAGSSEHGKDLAARHAEVVFAAQTTFGAARQFYADLKERARGHGRDPDSLKVLPGIYTIIGSTEEEARRRKAELDARVDPGPGLAKLAGQLGVPLESVEPDAPIPEHLLPDKADFAGSHGFLDAIVRLAREEKLTARDLVARIGGGHRMVVGSPEQLADGIEHWFRNGAADGFNIMPDVLPSGAEAFVDHVVPELRRRGLFRHEYAEATLRGHLGLRRPSSQYDQSAQTAQAARAANEVFETS